jgi:hypothetical protein
MRKILNRQIFYNFKVNLIIVLSIITLSVCGLFYYDTYQVAQSESGILFYPSHTFENNLSSWGSYYFGSRTSSFLSYYTFIFRFLTFPEFSYPFINQFLYYLSLSLLCFWGFFLLLTYFNPEDTNKNSKLYISLIGIYCPAALSTLARFQYSYIAFYFILPMILYLTLKIFDSKNYKDYLRYFLILNSLLYIYSIIYAVMASLILLFILWGLIASIYLIKNLSYSSLFKVLAFFGLWILLNSFWVIPFAIENKFPNTLINSTFHLNDQENSSTLQFFSKRDASFLNILTLINDEYINLFFREQVILKNLFRLINLLPLFTILLCLFISINKLNFMRKMIERRIYLLVFLFFLFLIIIRGANFPFGDLYLFLFNKINFLQIFRNNFEKGVLLFYLPYLLLFCLSLLILIQSRFKFLSYLILGLYLSFNSYLFFSSKIFLGDSYPYSDASIGYKIDVPDYYLQSSNIINSDLNNNDLNTLVMPLVDEGITYNWEYGYIGADILHQILSDKSYSFLSPDRYTDRSNILRNLPYVKDKNSVLDLLLFKYLVFRDDYSFENRSQLVPSILKQIYLNNQAPDLENLVTIKKYNLTAHNNQSYNSFEGNSYFSTDGSVQVTSDFEKSLYLKILPDSLYSLPVGKPYFILIQSPDIETISEFVNIDIKKELKDSLIFSNNRICKDCFVTEIINKTSTKPITSFSIKVFPKVRGSELKIDRIAIGLLKEDTNIKLNLQNLQKNKSELYLNTSDLQIVKCYSKYEKYENISKFIYENIDPTDTLYIKKSQFPEILNQKKLDDCLISYKKISNAEYEVFINPKESKDVYNTILNFNQSADSLWKLVSEEESIFGKITFDSDKNHFVSNTFSNSFYLENLSSESAKYKLIYIPEYYYHIFKYISITTYLIIFSIIVWLSYYKSSNK